MIEPQNQAPIIVLTGFLGAGKSTLLRQLLALPDFAQSGLVINEFGDVPIDHDLIAAGLPEVAVTSTGCICCTAGGDIRASVAEVHEGAKTLDRLPLPRVIVETTGLADPAPVVNQLVAGAVPALGLRDHTVARHYRLAGVVTLFDAANGTAVLDQHPECVKQVAFADTIILTKIDLLDGDDRDARLAAVTGKLRAINPAAKLMTIDDALLDLPSVFAARAYAPRDLDGEVEPWLEGLGHHHHNHHHHEHDHAHHHEHSHGNGHNHSHAGESDRPFGVSSFSIVRDEPIRQDALVHAMDVIQMFYGSRLLRLKGVIAFAEDPEAPYILQAVQHVVHPLARLPAWPSADHRTRIVVITFGVDPREVESTFLRLLAEPADAPQPMRGLPNGSNQARS